MISSGQFWKVVNVAEMRYIWTHSPHQTSIEGSLSYIFLCIVCFSLTADWPEADVVEPSV